MDRKLLLLINQQWTSPALDRAMAILSSFDFWLPLLLVAVLLLLWRGNFTIRAALLTAAVAAAVADGAISNPLKHWVARPRPHQAISGLRQVDLPPREPRLLAAGGPIKLRLSKADPKAQGRSFPSSHVANTAAVAGVVMLFRRNLGLLLLVVPLLVGYSRIYTAAHWPSDVAASLFLGAGVGVLCALAADRLWRRKAGEWLPQLAVDHPYLLPHA